MQDAVKKLIRRNLQFLENNISNCYLQGLCSFKFTVTASMLIFQLSAAATDDAIATHYLSGTGSPGMSWTKSMGP